ncbi:MAG: hypothetical protein ACRDRH_11175 [Pseudonocardia sp.]
MTEVVAAYQQAQAAETIVRWLLAHLGAATDAATLVATLDSDGHPVVRLTLEEGRRELVLRIIAGASAIEARPTDAA